MRLMISIVMAAMVACGLADSPRPFAKKALGEVPAFDFSALSNMALPALGTRRLDLRPVNGQIWRKRDGARPIMIGAGLGPEFWLEAVMAFSDAWKIVMRAAARRRAHEAKLRAEGWAEQPMSSADVRMRIRLLGHEFLFDRYGRLWYDARFVTPSERPALERLERVYRRLTKGGDGTTKPISPPRPPNVGEINVPEAVGRDIVPIFDREVERRKEKVLVFRGFEDERYQQYDDLILRMTADFNARRGEWAGATPAQAGKIGELSPVIVKSHMIEETGGNDARSLAAWATDPLQVNVPGDWCEAKTLVGLRQAKVRNEGTAENNVRAAIMFLVRKGFGVSGMPAANRPSSMFDGWPTALRRYNGRLDETMEGVPYAEAYSRRIRERADNPDRFVPIRIRVKK